MGQAPSSHYEPFLVDLETVKVTERLAVLPICEETFGDINSPLFRQFYAVRCDDSVRHWYCSPSNRDAINPPPPAEFIYRKFVMEATAYIKTVRSTADFTPIPVVLLKLSEPWLSPDKVPTVADLRAGLGCETIGYFGCRQFGANPERTDPFGVLGLFLAKAFHNEAKSVAILEIACRCYAEACFASGCSQPVWPAEVRFSTLNTNLPCLRLVQKLVGSMGPTYLEAWGSEMFMESDPLEQRFRVILRGGAIRNCAETLASQIDDTFVLKTKSVDPAPIRPIHPVLDAAVAAAKTKWLESNRAVHEDKPTRPSSTASASTVSATSPVPSESSTPRKPEPQPIAANSMTFYTNDPYCTRLGKPVIGTPIIRTPNIAVAPKLHTGVPRHFTPTPVEQSLPRPLVLFLPKRTTVSFWKKGLWLSAQWRREERLVKLASVQHALDGGLLCVEAVGDIELDIAIFDEWSRPAHLRLEQRCFYVPIQSVFCIDPATDYVSPFVLDPSYQTILAAASPANAFRPVRR